MIGRVTFATSIVVIALTITSPAASADADETSLEVHALGGVAIVGDDAAEGSASAPLVGVAFRASYATRDWFQYDVGVAAVTTTSASYDEGHFEQPGRPPVDGAFEVTSQLARLELGATARFGVRLIPRVSMFVGPQLRRTGEATAAGSPVRDAEVAFDVVAGTRVGFDYRLSRRLVIGADGAATYAVPITGEALTTIELGVHLSYYWYMR